MLKLVADESGQGRVYGFDVQKVALENASSLLEESVNPNEVSVSHNFISSFLLYLKEKTFQCNLFMALINNPTKNGKGG